MTPTRIACAAIVKNEAAHIAEWIAYQRALGFDTILLLDNQSTDTTADQARAFTPTTDVRVIDWPMTTPDYQLRAYEHAARTFSDEFDWIAFFDTDEFLSLEPGFDLAGILNLWRDAAAIGIPWAIFGSSGHETRPDGLIIEQFTHRATPEFGPNRHIKSIIRPSRMKSCINAHAFDIDGEYLSLAGTRLTFSQPGVLDTPPDYAMGKLHHYFTRSKAHWTAKMQRGYHDTARAESEFEAYDRNEIPDTSATRHAAQVRDILAAANLPTPATPDQPAPPENQASRSFLKERTKEPSLHYPPGQWALLTEFGTLLCWNPADQTMSHRPPGDLAGHSLVYWRRTNHDDLIVEIDGTTQQLDPTNGRAAPPTQTPPLTIRDGEAPGDIVFDLGHGFFLSARRGPSTHEAGTVDFHVYEPKAWENFTPLDAAAAADLCAIAPHRWVIRAHPEAPPDSPLRLTGRHSFTIADRTYAIAENLPLHDATRSPTGTISTAILTREGWKTDEIARFRPLIVFTLFGSEAIEPFRLASESLRRFGRYDGPLLVIGDQPAPLIRSLFPEPTQPLVMSRTIEARDQLDRDTAWLILADAPELTDFQPVICASPATMFDAPLRPTLQALRLSDKISVPIAPSTTGGPPPNPLVTNDPTASLGFPEIAAEIIGLPTLTQHRRTLRALRRALDAYVDQTGRNHDRLARQAATYIAAKLNDFAPGPLAAAIHQGDAEATPSGATGIRTFATGRATTDTAAMRNYRDALIPPPRRLTGETAIDDMSDQEVLAHFQSIGDNCEFGSVQRHFGLERLGFLKWCRSTARTLAHGIEDGFSAIGNPDNFYLEDHLGEYFLTDALYEISGHSFVKIGTVDEDRFRQEQLKRIRYLRDKFLEDIESGDEIFLYNCHKDHPQATVDDFIALMSSIKSRGSCFLVCVSPAKFTNRQVGTVEWLDKRLLHAHKDEYTTFDSTAEQYAPGWLTICRTVLAMVTAASRQKPVVTENAPEPAQV